MGLGLLERRLVFVTGKGGVGKTSVAGALGLLAARADRRVLVCELEATGALPSMFGLDGAVYAPRQVEERLFVSSMDTEQALREYLGLTLRVPFVDRIGPLAEALDFVAQAAPGVRELLAVGKLCYEVREQHYDLVIVDATASGHVIGHLSAPIEIHELAASGAVGHETAWMVELLTDPELCGAIVVTTPAETPVNEACELAARLASAQSVPLAFLLANRVLAPLFAADEAERFEELSRDPRRLESLVDDADPTALAAVVGAARFSVARRREIAEQLKRLSGAVEGVEVLFLPELGTPPRDLESLEALCDALVEELGL